MFEVLGLFYSVKSPEPSVNVISKPKALHGVSKPSAHWIESNVEVIMCNVKGVGHSKEPTNTNWHPLVALSLSGQILF